MSGPSGARPASGDGVTRSSALSFLAQAQAGASGLQDKPEGAPRDGAAAVDPGMPAPETLVPAGVRALLAACTQVYPDQPNPLQVTTRLKYWLGGHDPLDYISMYWHAGDQQLRVPPHWHYVSFGMSDLHGDGRVHPLAPPSATPGAPPESGLGAELTFRLLAPPGQLGGTSGPPAPPLWPAALLQALARYVFTTGNRLVAGDHVSWHAPLDGGGGAAAAGVGAAGGGGGAGGRSRLRHLLVAEEPRLAEMQTPHGTVKFLQMVGCTGRELRAAQRGSGARVLRALQAEPRCGGPYLVSDPRRRRSARGLRGGAGASEGGAAPLAGVSAPVYWEGRQEAECSPEQLSQQVSDQIKQTLRRGLNSAGEGEAAGGDVEGHMSMSTDSFEMSSLERALPPPPPGLAEGSWAAERAQHFSRVHLVFTPEGASLLPLAIRGRVSHGRHFTWRGARSVTLLHPRVMHALPQAARPYAALGSWLQVLIPEDLAEDMASKLGHLSALADTDSETDSEGEGEGGAAGGGGSLKLPLKFSWPERGLDISVVNDGTVL